MIETYTYGGRGGRVSSKITRIEEYDYSVSPPMHLGNKQWSQSWTWHQLGGPETITYPSCIYECGANPPPSLVVTQTYTNGWLTALHNQSSYYYGSSIGYHPNGMFRIATHGNGMVSTVNPDPNRMGRPASITASYGGVNSWTSGTYAYDGSGNVRAIGADWYIYDRLGRLVEGTSESGAKRQNLTIDPHGNITLKLTSELES